MSKAEPTIQKYMTTDPVYIQAGERLQTAIDMMAQRKIRHLPVMQQDRVVGILSDRDIKLAQSIQGIDTAQIPVIDICIENPYAVEPDASLSSVVETMASKHYGSVIVTQNKKLVGIFTAVDACRALSEVLKMRFHER